ncbi:MAG: hypothetical protein JWM10_351 [Myxococcaceae bacterium]|nr:hypothetical protein [Myxococcaceae bacterium]
MAVDRIENPFRSTRASSDRHAVPPAPLPLRGMTGHEEEIVERYRALPNTATLCNELVARCAVAPGADFTEALSRVRGLTVVERDLALLAVRRLSLGDRVAMEVECPACRARSAADFRLSDLPLPTVAPPSEVRASLTDASVAVMRLPTAGDQEDLLDAGLQTDAERRTFLLARALVRLGDREGPFAVDAVRALGVADRKAMEAALEAALPDLDLGMEAACAQCEHRFTATFDVAAFFLPR